jgi:hypothetical protein
VVLLPATIGEKTAYREIGAIILGEKSGQRLIGATIPGEKNGRMKISAGATIIQKIKLEIMQRVPE